MNKTRVHEEVASRRFIFGLDPGTWESAWVLFDRQTKLPIAFDLEDNRTILSILRLRGVGHLDTSFVVEMLKSYGNALGDTSLETCVFIGSCLEAFKGPQDRISRKTIVSTICGNPRANDSSIRMALIDLYGHTKDKAIGTKQTPGPLYGIRADIWQALAICVAYDNLLDLESKGIETYLSKRQEVWNGK